MGKFFKAVGGSIVLGIVGAFAFMVGSAFSYLMGLVGTLIGLTMFAWLMPEVLLDELPRAVLVSVLLIVPFLFTATGSIKASLKVK